MAGGIQYRALTKYGWISLVASDGTVLFEPVRPSARLPVCLPF